LINCWHWWLGIEPTTLDLCSQSGAYDLATYNENIKSIEIAGMFISLRKSRNKIHFSGLFIGALSTGFG